MINALRHSWLLDNAGNSLWIFTLVFLLITGPSNAQTGKRDTAYVRLTDHLYLLEKNVEVLREGHRSVIPDFALLKKIIQGLDSLSPAPDDFSKKDSTFANTQYADYAQAFHDLLDRRDTLSYLLDSLYYKSSFDWFSGFEKDRFTHQRILASYYFLSNKAANLIGSLKNKTVDSLIDVRDNDLERLQTQFNTTLAQLNTKLKATKLLDYKPRDNELHATELKKLIYILTEIQKGDSRLPDNLKAFAELYEQLWNTRFLMAVRNIDSVAVFKPRERETIKKYTSAILKNLDSSPQSVKKIANYVLTFHSANLLNQIRKVVTLVPSDAIRKKVSTVSHLTDTDLDTLTLQQLTYLYKQTIQNLTFAPLVDSLRRVEQLFQTEINRSLENIQRIKQNVVALKDEFWAVNVPFEFDIYVKPGSNRVWIEVMFRFSENPPMNTGLAFELECDWSKDNSLVENLTAMIDASTPYHIDKVAFTDFLERLGFRKDFLTMSPNVEHLSSEIEFLYLGEKVSWSIFSADLADLSTMAPELRTNTVYQIKEVLLGKVSAELQREFQNSILGTNRLFKEYVKLNWQFLNTNTFTITTSPQEVKVRISLQPIATVLDTSYAEFIFRRTGIVGRGKLHLSPEVYARILDHICAGFIVEKETAANTFTLLTPGRQRIGTIFITATEYTFTPANSLKIPVPTDWQLETGDFNVDLTKQELTFSNAIFHENIPYSRFERVTGISGTIAFEKGRIAIHLLPTSANALSNSIIRTLEKWNMIPPGLIIASVELLDNKIQIKYRGIEEAIANGMDAASLDILSQVSTAIVQTQEYTDAIEKSFRNKREAITEALFRLAQDVRTETIQKFITQYRQLDVLRFSNVVTARVEVQNNARLVMGVYSQLVTCNSPLFRIEVSKTDKVQYKDFNTTCLLEYVKGVIPAAGSISTLEYNEDKQRLQATFSIDINGIKGEGTIALGLDGSIVTDDHFFSEQEFVKQLGDEVEKEFKDNLSALRDSLDRQYGRMEVWAKQTFGEWIYKLEPIRRGDLPVGIRLSMKIGDVDLIAENIVISLDGSVDYSACKLDLEGLRLMLNKNLNEEIVSIRKITPLFGKNSFKVKVDLNVQERRYLNIYTTVTSTVDFLSGNASIKIDVQEILFKLGLREVINEAVFKNKNILALDYDDLKFNLYRDRTDFPEGLVKFYGEAVISTNPNIVFPIEITVPIFPGLLDRYQVRMLTDERAIFANIESGLTGLLPSDWGSFGIFSFHTPRLTYNSRNFPNGISVQIDLALEFLEGARVSMPQLIINQDGVSFGQFDRIAISIPVNCPIPPYFIFTSGYGELTKEYIRLGGRMTVMPAPEMENIILLDGQFTYRFDNLLALQT